MKESWGLSRSPYLNQLDDQKRGVFQDAPTPNGQTPHTPIGMGLLPDLHHGDKRGNHPLYLEGTGSETRVLVMA
jgi:hypothetical protein